MRCTVPALVALSLALSHVDASAADVAFRLNDAKGAPVPDVVVSLHTLDAAGSGPTGPTAPNASDIVIVQSHEAFSPFVTPLRVGTSVIFDNKDAVQHHVYSLSKVKRFEIPLSGGGVQTRILFDQPGVVALGCNIHDWMVGYVVVLPTALFAKSGSDGRAAIASVPIGRYRAEIWHPRLGEVVKQDVVVSEGATPAEITAVLTLKPDRRIRRAPDGARGGYP